MSLEGFKKKLSVKIGGTEDTELDVDFEEMLRKTDVIDKSNEELIKRTLDLLEPNSVHRAKLAAINVFTKLGGQVENCAFIHSESGLGECMSKYGMKFGKEFVLGEALVDAGETFKNMADIKHGYVDDVKHNFIEPLQQLQSTDLKEVKYLIKQVEDKHLDLSYIKRKQTTKVVSDEEITNAKDKLEKSKEVTSLAMHNLLENDVEYVSQLSALIDAEVKYHQQALYALQSLSDTLSHLSTK